MMYVCVISLKGPSQHVISNIKARLQSNNKRVKLGHLNNCVIK